MTRSILHTSWPILLIAPLLLLQSCTKDPAEDPSNGTNSEGGQATFELNFRGYFNSELFMREAYTEKLSGADVKVTLLKMYVSDVTLVKENGEEILVKDIHLFDFSKNHQPIEGSNKTGKTTHQGGEYLTVQVDTGQYKGIKFGLGVKPALNKTEPSQYEDGHPLSYEANYWSWNSGYRFVMFEGRADTTDDGQANFDLDLAYHLGLDEFYMPMEYVGQDHNFVVQQGQETQFVCNIDLQNWFDNGFQNEEDIHIKKGENLTHTTGEGRPLAAKLHENIPNSFFTEVMYAEPQDSSATNND
jgi:hypothetical protein